MARLNSRVGRLPLRRGVGRGRLRDAAVLTWCIPNGDVAATANDPYPVLYIVYNNLARCSRNADRDHHRRAPCGCAALASVTSMGAHVVRVRARRRHAGLALLKRVSPRYRTPVWAILVTSALAVVDLRLRRGVFRRDVDQHDRALPRLRHPDLPQLAQPAPAAGEFTTPRDRALEPRPLGAGRSTSSRSSGSRSSPWSSACRRTSWCSGRCCSSVPRSASTGSLRRDERSGDRPPEAERDARSFGDRTGPIRGDAPRRKSSRMSKRSSTSTAGP